MRPAGGSGEARAVPPAGRGKGRLVRALPHLAVALLSAALFLGAVALLAMALFPEARMPAHSTPAPTAAAVASPVPAVASEPTPFAARQLAEAARLERNGEYEAAADKLRLLLDAGAPAEAERAVLASLGRCELGAGAYAAAAESLARFVERYPDDAEVPAVLFRLGVARMGAGDGRGAAEAYRRYLDARPLLASYVQARIGDALAAAGEHEGALAAYGAAIAAETDAATKASVLERQAATLAALRRTDEAVAAYEQALELSEAAAVRARVMLAAGAALEQAGRREEAAAQWNALVSAYPQTSYAAEALATLDEWQLARVGAVERARVEYGAGRYESALGILSRHINGDAGHLGDAHYWAALAHRRLGRHQGSVRELDLLIDTHPQNTLVSEAWYERGESLLLAGDVDGAVASYRTLVARFPTGARAVQAAWRIAQAYQDAGRDEEAAQAFAQAAAAYPGATWAADARFCAGLAHYAAGRRAEAVDAWQGYLAQETDPDMRARLLLWLGKAAASQGDTAGAQARWQEATQATPDGFWGLRARDLLAGRRFTGSAPEGEPDPARYAMRGDVAEAERWLATWAPALPAGQERGALPASVEGLEAFRRGMELWAIGDAAAARTELRKVQTACWDDPWALYALALHYGEQGLYQQSILAASRLLALAPEEARGEAPRALEELAYPTYYADLVVPEAGRSGTDPNYFFALIYQESRFDAKATSYADARGLTQVIPSTGSYIAGRLGDDTYGPEKLWRPAVSVRYGLWYIAAALDMFEGDGLAALVAYNAGPTNASKWHSQAAGDPDLFFERVASAQPRAYVELIYEHWAHYERLYGR